MTQKNSSAKQDRKTQVAISQRRKVIAEFLQNNLTETEIANRLGVDISTVSRDIVALKAEATEFVYSLAKDSLAYFYKSTLDDINKTRLEAWKIYHSYDSNNDPLKINLSGSTNQAREKLLALKIVIASNESMFNLLQAGPTVMSVRALSERLERLEQGQQQQPKQEITVSNG